MYKLHKYISIYVMILIFSLQGLAGGTFLYITFFEILPHELSLPQNRLCKTAAVAAGFIVIAVIIGLAS